MLFVDKEIENPPVVILFADQSKATGIETSELCAYVLVNSIAITLALF